MANKGEGYESLVQGDISQANGQVSAGLTNEEANDADSLALSQAGNRPPSRPGAHHGGRPPWAGEPEHSLATGGETA